MKTIYEIKDLHILAREDFCIKNKLTDDLIESEAEFDMEGFFEGIYCWKHEADVEGDEE